MAALALCVLMLGPGCYRTVAGHPSGQGRQGSSTALHTFWGLSPADHGQPCPEGFSYVQVRQPWWSLFFLAPATGGCLSASVMRYECAPTRGGGQ